MTNSTKAFMENFIKDFTAAVSSGISLQESIEMISDIYQHPAVLIDSSYRILGSSAESSTLPLSFTHLRNIDFFNSSVKKSTYNYYDLSDITHYARNHYALIFIKQAPVAAICIFEEYIIDATKLSYLPLIASILSMQLQMEDTMLVKHNKDFNHLLSLLLDDHTTDTLILQERFRLLGYPILKHKYLLTAELASPQDLPADKRPDAMGAFLKRLFSNAIYMVLEQYIVVFISLEEPMSSETLSEAGKRLKNHGVRLGISNRFTELIQAKSHLIESMDALKFGSRKNPDAFIYVYNDYQLDKIADALSHLHDFNIYIYPPVKDLVEYDRDNKGCLIPTLKAYLKKSSRPQDVCNDLFIHKNTLYYRLDKIKSILNADLDDVETTTKILLSLKILELRDVF